MHPRAAAAMGSVTKRTEVSRANDLLRLAQALGRPVDSEAVRDLVSLVRENARLILNFHPDRLDRNRKSVAWGMRRAGRYLPQRYTGLSNGGRSAVPGGERTLWESALFGKAYDGDECTPPIYGSLDLFKDPFGGSPRFGSCLVVLGSECFDRATFCVGDSHVGPRDVGTIDSFYSILAGLFEQAVLGDALERGLTTDDVMDSLRTCAALPTPARELDGYIETQIHGGVSLRRDVTAVVLDPSFRDSDVASDLAKAADECDFRLRWHTGSLLDADDVPDDFRGPQVRTLASEVAGSSGTIDAAAIGRSASLIPFSPPSVHGDSADSALQQHKFLWHCLLRFGRDST